MPQHNSRTKRPRKPKFVTMEAHHTSNPRTYLEVKRSRSTGRLMMRQEVRHIFRTWRPTNFKLVHGWNTKTYISETTVTSNVKGQGRKVMWHIWHMLADKSRTKRPRNTEGKVVHPTGNNAHQFQGQRSRSPGLLMMRQEVRHIFRTGRPTNFKLGTQMEDKDLHHWQAPWPQRSRSQGHVIHLAKVKVIRLT